ncbi:unnamed protein product, partial [Tetraodon nigroviridis]
RERGGSAGSGNPGGRSGVPRRCVGPRTLTAPAGPLLLRRLRV